MFDPVSLYTILVGLFFSYTITLSFFIIREPLRAEWERLHTEIEEKIKGENEDDTRLRDDILTLIDKKRDKCATKIKSALSGKLVFGYVGTWAVGLIFAGLYDYGSYTLSLGLCILDIGILVFFISYYINLLRKIAIAYYDALVEIYEKIGKGKYRIR